MRTFSRPEPFLRAESSVGILVIGATGRLGRAVAERASSLGIEVIRASRRVGLDVVLDPANFAEVEAIVRARRPEAIVCAAGAGVPAGPALAEDVLATHLGTVLRVAEQRSVRALFIGSAAEYGNPGSSGPVAENVEGVPLTSYGRVKRQATEVVTSAWERGARVMTARVFNVVGAAPAGSQQPVDELAARVRSSVSGETVTVGNTATVRDLIAVEEAADSLVRLALLPSSPPIVNVCSGSGVSFGELVAAMLELRGIECEIVDLGRVVPVPAIVGDCALLESLTGGRALFGTRELAARALND